MFSHDFWKTRRRQKTSLLMTNAADTAAAKVMTSLQGISRAVNRLPRLLYAFSGLERSKQAHTIVGELGQVWTCTM